MKSLTSKKYAVSNSKTIEFTYERIRSVAALLAATLGNKTKVGYMASPYTALGLKGLKKTRLENKRFSDVTKVAALLTKAYVAPLIAPITTSHMLKAVSSSKQFKGQLKGTWKDWAEIDTQLLARSDYVVLSLMDGWERSIGVKAELDLALNRFKIPVITYDPKTKQFGSLEKIGGELDAVYKEGTKRRITKQ